jgi:hypothetical protein
MSPGRHDASRKYAARCIDANDMPDSEYVLTLNETYICVPYNDDYVYVYRRDGGFMGAWKARRFEANE